MVLLRICRKKGRARRKDDSVSLEGIRNIMGFGGFGNFLKRIIHAGRKRQKKAGLALGSGGARGMAHIGVLRAFEEEGIKFDYVCGSSIGAIIGGMYAAGYSAASMEAYIMGLDLANPRTLIRYKLEGMTIKKALDEMMGGADFDELKMPFAAVASDLDSGEEVVMRTGNIADAMCASSAVIPAFRPVEKDGRRLIDGAYVSCVPSAATKKMGADVVIGVNLSAELDDNLMLKKALDAFYPTNRIPLLSRKDEPYKNCSCMLEPDLRQYSSVSLTQLCEIEDAGYKAAKKMMPEIKKALAGTAAAKRRKG